MNISLPAKYKPVLGLILISSFVRLLIAAFIELGNDEVYYHTYALFPDWSHFDHPPMVGWVIKFFSLGMFMKAAWLMRLPSIILAAVNTWLIFELGSLIKNEKTGWYASLMYTASIYTSLIAGIFIMPDTPQVFFWLVSLYLMVDILPDKDMVAPSKRKLLILGLLIGLGMLSKYTSVFLWFGIFLYLIFYNRNWFKSWQLYVSGIISIVVFSPVLIWNYMHHFISFTFHGDRVDVQGSEIRFDLVGTEILGEFLYQNPVIFILVWTAVIYGIRNHTAFIEKRKFHLLLFQALPMIFVFLFFSLFRRTLPHWTGPAYISLILIGAAFLSRKNRKRIFNYPPVLTIALGLLITTLALGLAEINYGFLNTKSFLKKDVTLDMYGWKQLRKKFEPIKIKAEKERLIQQNAPIISPRWFPASHLDYYVAQPNNTYVMGWGSLERIHKYAWINKDRGGYKKGMDVWYITMDTDFMDPWMGEKYFENSIAYDTIEIERSNEVVKKAYIYIFENLQEIPPNDFADFMEKHQTKSIE